MAISMVRKPSETPNISNIEDIIPFRYAYGNQNGYVKNRGNELSYTINGNIFTINSGRIVLQGVESDIDANGYSLPLNIIQGNRFVSIYYKVNLGLNTVTIESVDDTVDYPPIDLGDDLTETPTGISSLLLYHLQINNGVINNVQKVVKPINYINDEEGTSFNSVNLIDGGTIASTVTGITQPLDTKNNTIATTDFVQQLVTMLLEDKMNKFELIASPNTETYDMSTAINNGYKFIIIVSKFTSGAAGSGETIETITTKPLPISALKMAVIKDTGRNCYINSSNILSTGADGSDWDLYWTYRILEIWGQK